MSHSKSDIYFHFVWATYLRKPLITPSVERELYRCVQQESQRLRCTVLALNGMPDHVHLLVKAPTTISPARLMQQVKGVSSSIVNDTLDPDELFRWQENYGVFSVSRSHVKRVTAYVQNQKRHHAGGKVWDEWEETEITDDFE